MNTNYMDAMKAIEILEADILAQEEKVALETQNLKEKKAELKRLNRSIASEEKHIATLCEKLGVTKEALLNGLTAAKLNDSEPSSNQKVSTSQEEDKSNESISAALLDDANTKNEDAPGEKEVSQSDAIAYRKPWNQKDNNFVSGGHEVEREEVPKERPSQSKYKMDSLV